MRAKIASGRSAVELKKEGHYSFIQQEDVPPHRGGERGHNDVDGGGVVRMQRSVVIKRIKQSQWSKERERRGRERGERDSRRVRY